MQLLLSFVQLLLWDLGFVLLMLIPVMIICMRRKATFAVLKRNFVGYFNNPTGYVFLCLFVVLCSFGAFWPPEFFNDNLATLNQLSRWLPLIMLVFVPAITMAVWSEERREGTDELLLTLPASDLDIVLGKYIAAIGVFSVSLFFSQMVSYWVLAFLARSVTPDGVVALDLDVGLLFANYIGYWLIGIAMLAVGMVASFLTNNLTVAFVLGLVLNTPLVIISYATSVIPTEGWAQSISPWSIGAQFDDFARGVLSLSSLTYFAMLVVVGIYLCLVLIGKRHWYGGQDGHSMLGHYIVRTISLILIAISATWLLSLRDFRWDISQGKISSLSAETKEVIGGLEPEYKIRIDAFIGKDIPDRYIETKSNLVNMLKELGRRNSQIELTINENLELFSDEAQKASDQFGIEPTDVFVQRGGRIEQKQVLMGAAFRCGLQKVVVPFFEYGIPVEYELVRSIATVAEVERKKLGIVQTEAAINGGGQFPKQQIVDELERQYDVENVNLNTEIDTLKYDVLMVVQPSSLDPQGFQNLLTAIRQGIPTAIFEDPRPEFLNYVTPTGQPKRPAGGNPMMGMGGRPQPKGNIEQLWRLLGIRSPGRNNAMSGPMPMFQPDVVWQRGYQPYPKLEQRGISEEWVFIPPEGLSEDDPVTSGLQEVFFPVPGAVEEDKDADNQLVFTPLVETTKDSGLISFEKYVANFRNPLSLIREQGTVQGKKVLAARIQGQVPQTRSMSTLQEDPADKDAKESEAEAKEDDERRTKLQEQRKERGIDVIYVADIDLMLSAFFSIRARPEDPQMAINWKFENVTFLLNIIDSLSGEDAFVSIRKRKPRYSTLRQMEEVRAQARTEQEEQRQEKQKEIDKAREDAEKKIKELADSYQKKINDLEENMTSAGADKLSQDELDQRRTELDAQRSQLQRQLEIQGRQLQVNQQKYQRQFQKEAKRIQREQDKAIEAWQFRVKMAALVIPPLPPLLIGLLVFFRRRVREREGVSTNRLR